MQVLVEIHLFNQQKKKKRSKTLSRGNDLQCVTVPASRVLMECRYIRVYSYAFGIVLLSRTGDPAPAVTLSTRWPSREYREVCPLTSSKRWHGSSDEMATCEFYYLDPFIQIDYLYVPMIHCQGFFFHAYCIQCKNDENK